MGSHHAMGFVSCVAHIAESECLGSLMFEGVEFDGYVASMSYVPSPEIVADGVRIEAVSASDYSANQSKALCILEYSPNQKLAIAKWVSPKRTRSYPFARLYRIYHFGCKRVAIIPLIKDEGVGESRNKSNNDRINFTTLSWMNLMNIYVVLAWYDNAEKKSSTRITSQALNEEHIRKQLDRIAAYQFDAHHWNQNHFRDDFIPVLDNAVSSYRRIAADLEVSMHDFDDHIKFRDRVVDLDSPSNDKLSLERFEQHSVPRSRAAAKRETTTIHADEDLDENSEKAVFNIRNNLGGIYPITTDEVFIDEESKTVVIRESKNSTKDGLPSEDDIYDGLFKLLLFKHIQLLSKDGVQYTLEPQLRLTGILNGPLRLPEQNAQLEAFISSNAFTRGEIKLLRRALAEAKCNSISVLLEPNDLSRPIPRPSPQKRLSLNLRGFLRGKREPS